MKWIRKTLRCPPVVITCYCSRCGEVRTATLRKSTGSVHHASMAAYCYCGNWLGRVREG